MENEENLPEFGIKREREERRDGGCGIVFDPETQKYAVGYRSEGGLLGLFAGGVDDNEDIQKGVEREVVEESGLHNFLYIEKIGAGFAHYYNSLRKVNRVTKSTCFLFILKDRDLIEVKHEEHEKFSLAWATAEEIFVNWESKNKEHNLDHWLYFFKKSIKRAKELGYDTTSVLENLN